MKILLCNDTGIKPHVGCQAVSDAHARMLGRMGHVVHHRYFVNELSVHARSTLAETMSVLDRQDEVMERIRTSDAVIVNGEGTLHHNNGKEYIALLMLAKRLGKATLIVNSIYQEMDIDATVLNDLDAFFVRDPRSEAYAKSKGVKCSYAPDSILEAGFTDEVHMDFRGNIVVTDWLKARDADVGTSCTRFLAEAPSNGPRFFFPFHSDDARATWHMAAASAATAGVLVTGRHHGIYLSVIAGIPFVPMASNSWKIEAMLESLDLSIMPCSNYGGLVKLLDEVKSRKSSFAEAAKRLRAKAPLPIFDILGKGDDITSEEIEVDRLRMHIASRPRTLHEQKISVTKRRLREAKMRLKFLEGNGRPVRRGWRGAIDGMGHFVNHMKKITGVAN